MAQPSKQAFLYVLNRETGDTVWHIVASPVYKGTVPKETVVVAALDAPGTGRTRVAVLIHGDIRWRAVPNPTPMTRVIGSSTI